MSNKNHSNTVPPNVKWPTEVVVALITVAGAIITGILVYFGNRNQALIPIQATQTAEARLTSAASLVAQTDVPAETQQPALTFAPLANLIGYDFEAGTQGWGTSEGQFKLAELSITSAYVYHGNQALQLDTELYGSGSQEFANHNSEDVYRHTEAVVYFDKIPEGVDSPGPYDLTGKRLSCFVFVPSGLLAPNDAPPAYIRLLVKDTNFANQFSAPMMITTETTEKWIEIILVVSENPDPNSDPNFDATQAYAMGVRLDSLDDSTVSYSGPIYIDFCTIGL